MRAMDNENEGRHLLAAWLLNKRKTAKSLADTLRVSAASVSYWLDGSRRPDAHSRELLALLCGIEPNRWQVAKERDVLELVYQQINRMES